MVGLTSFDPPYRIKANMLSVDEAIAAAFATHLAAEGVRPYGTTRQRWCTHLDVTREDIDRSLACVDGFFARAAAPARTTGHG